MKLLRAFLLEDGQGLTEYALILGLVVIAAVGVFGVLGKKISDTLYATSMDALPK